MQQAGLQPVGKRQHPADVAGHHAQRQPVHVVIGQCDALLVGIERGHHRHRAEDLLAEGRVVGRHTSQHGGLVDQALVLPAGGQGGPGADRSLDDAVAVVALGGIDQWPDQHLGIGPWVAGADLRHLGHQPVHERVIQAPLHQDAAGGHADLPLVQETAPGRVVHCQLQVGVVQHQQRILAAQFQRHLLQVPATGLTDLAAGSGGTGELDRRHLRVGGQRRTGGAIAGQHLQQARRQAGLLEQPGNHGAAADRGARVGLEHHRVAQCQRRCHRTHRQVEREIERRNHPDHADRAPPGQAHPSAAAGQHLALAAAGQLAGLQQRGGGDGSLHRGLGPAGTGLAGQPHRNLPGMGAGQLAGAAQHIGPLPAGQRRPGRLRGRRRGAGPADGRRIGQSDLPEPLAGGRFDHIGHIAPGHPPAIEHLCMPQRRWQPITLDFHHILHTNGVPACLRQGQHRVNRCQRLQWRPLPGTQP